MNDVRIRFVFRHGGDLVTRVVPDEVQAIRENAAAVWNGHTDGNASQVVDAADGGPSVQVNLRTVVMIEVGDPLPRGDRPGRQGWREAPQEVQARSTEP